MQRSLCYQASAPGKLVLMGEHAVLKGELSLVCAINRRVRVRLRPLDEKRLIINSDFGSLDIPWSELKNTTQLPYVTAVCRAMPDLPYGVSLEIDSDIPRDYGLGSSAAITAATSAVLWRWLGVEFDKLELFNFAKKALDEAQNGEGSGVDLAASIFGGTVAYRLQPFAITKLPVSPNIAAIYSGSKRPTREVIQQVAAQSKKNPALYANYFSDIGDLTKQAVTAIQQKQWKLLGNLMRSHQEIQTVMQLSTPELDSAMQTMLAEKNILAAKISGSGLGDCAIGLLDVNTNQDNKQVNNLEEVKNNLQKEISAPLQLVDCAVDIRGVYCESA